MSHETPKLGSRTAAQLDLKDSSSETKLVHFDTLSSNQDDGWSAVIKQCGSHVAASFWWWDFNGINGGFSDKIERIFQALPIHWNIYRGPKNRRFLARLSREIKGFCSSVLKNFREPRKEKKPAESALCCGQCVLFTVDWIIENLHGKWSCCFSQLRRAKNT